METTTTTTTTSTPMPTSTSKKQKRNHREKHKVNNRRSRITPLQPENYSHPDFDMTKTSSSPIEEQVLATGVLQRLEQATMNALEKCLSPSSIRNNFKEFAEQQKNESKWKSSYRILPPSKRERKQSQVRAVSSICAQISGHLNSTVSTYRIPRDLLVQQVVQTIRNAEESLIAPNNNDSDITIPSTYNHKVSITCIEAHQPSGQISFTIQVKEGIAKIDTKASMHNNENEKDTEMNESPSKEHDKIKPKSNSDNNFGKLAHWYEKTTGKQLNLEPNKHCITIETLPAHQSALNPDVHRLYAHYQHVVHKDPNPFSNDPNVDVMSSNDDNDDEDEEPKLETDDPSELDWGKAPTYFTSNISTMLNAYIQSFDSEECRRSVLSNFYSFYQFLVEAPFPHPNVCNKQIKIPYDNSRSTQQIPGLSWNENNDYPSSPLPCGLYHQHYRLGGQFLIAVGVIDILPTGLSSVYLFYHPSFSYDLVALGKYAILKEIEFARDVLKVPYYYLGY
jgi:arginine-tRNA-protein transferase